MPTARDYQCDLDVLQEMISPLPWSEFCESGSWWIESADEDGSPLLPTDGRNFVVGADDIHTSNMLYIVWAANVVPELVKALAEAERREAVAAARMQIAEAKVDVLLNGPGSQL